MKMLWAVTHRRVTWCSAILPVLPRPFWVDSFCDRFTLDDKSSGTLWLCKKLCFDPYVVICLVWWYLTLSGIWLFIKKSNPPSKNSFSNKWADYFSFQEIFSIGLINRKFSVKWCLLNIAFYKIYFVVRTGLNSLLLIMRNQPMKALVINRVFY